jgi:2-oxoglutarate ferredoxin oxidoreductase subunit gamma
MAGTDSSRKEVRFTGFGGQGMAVIGNILGRAAAVYDGKQATMTQSYGPEARGGASSSQVIISDGRIFYPYVIESDILVGMSQEGYDKHRSSLKKSTGVLLYDEDLVSLDPKEDAGHIYTIPATRFAEELGRKIVANIVMLGFLSGITEIVSEDALKKAISDSVPKPTIQLNLKAFDRGREHAKKLLEGSAVKAKS